MLDEKSIKEKWVEIIRAQASGHVVDSAALAVQIARWAEGAATEEILTCGECGEYTDERSLKQWGECRACHLQAERDDLFAKDLENWTAMLREVAKVSDDLGLDGFDFDPNDGWSHADDDTLLEQFDPWSVIRKVKSLFASRGVVMIALERERQVSVEGWTAEHDDQHTDGEMAQAAACYAALSECDPETQEHFAVEEWPDEWDIKWYKPKDAQRDLERSGALSAAEIDRLLRKAQ